MTTKNFIVAFCIFISAGSYSQELKLSKPNLSIIPADTASYEIIENTGNIEVHQNIEIRKKITYYRKEGQDFLLDFGNGLKVLIFKEEE